MLNQLEIINYQSHEHTIYNFHPGVNCIIGESGHGKTASLRAFNLLVNHRPLRFRYHSDFAKIGRTSVKAITAEGIEAKIVKTKKKAKYVLITNGKKEEWPKLNKQVPDRVKDALNISDLNIQWQFDNPFLISTSPGEIARVINEKTKIEEADEWIRTLNKNINILKRKQHDEELDIEENLKELKILSPLPKLNTLLNRMDFIDKKIAKLDNEYIQIDSIIASIEDVENKIKEQKQYLNAKQYILEIEQIDKQIERLLDEKELIEKVNQLQVDITLSSEYKEEFIKKYIKILKREKICPTCFGPIGKKEIKRITNEIYTVI